MQVDRVITFHGIGEPQRGLDPGEAPYWIGADRYRDVLDRIVAHPERDRIAITFDDGNLSDLAIGAAELKRRGLAATFFILSGRIGTGGSLGADDIRDLMRTGMAIGSHGVDHRDWTALSAAELRHELVSSAKDLAAICGEPIRLASVPFGRWNAAVVRSLRAAGYEAAYTSDRGRMHPSQYVRARTSIRNDMDGAAIDSILNGTVPALQGLRRMAAMALKRIV